MKLSQKLSLVAGAQEAVKGPAQQNDIADAIIGGTITEYQGNVSSVKSYAFAGCNKLAKINLPSAVTFGTYAFQGCTSLKTVHLPAASTMGGNAFNGCTSLTHIVLPKLSAVGASVFNGCTALQIADLPAAKSIAANAFANCKSLTAVILRATGAIATVQSTSFNGASSDWYAYVPKSMVDSYLNSGGQWENLYSDKIRAIEDYPDICG